MEDRQQPTASRPEPPEVEVTPWNTPEAIARHRSMTPEERLRRTIELSRAALRFARAERVDDR